MRLNGWLRIGIVLSVLWWIGASAYYFSDEMARQKAYSDAMYSWRSTCIGENAVRRMNNQPERECITEEAVAASFHREIPWGPILIIPTAVLILAWIAIAIAYGCIRWIVRGFKPRA